MEKEKIDTNNLREKILLGIEKAFEKLVNSKKQNDGILIFSRNGKIVKVKAREV